MKEGSIRLPLTIKLSGHVGKHAKYLGVYRYEGESANGKAMYGTQHCPRTHQAISHRTSTPLLRPKAFILHLHPIHSTRRYVKQRYNGETHFLYCAADKPPANGGDVGEEVADDAMWGRWHITDSEAKVAKNAYSIVSARPADDPSEGIL